MSSLNAPLVLGHRLILHHHPNRRVPSCESFLIPAGRSRATPTSPTIHQLRTNHHRSSAQMSAVTMHNVAWSAVAPAPMHYPSTYRAVPACPASELYDGAAQRAYDAYMPRDDVRPYMHESLVKKRTRQRVYPSEEAKQAAKMLQKARRREQNRNAQRRLRDRKEEHIFKVSPHAPLGVDDGVLTLIFRVAGSGSGSVEEAGRAATCRDAGAGRDDPSTHGAAF